MRLIATLDDQHQAYALSTFLLHKGIENQLELSTNSDWGSDEYGNVLSRIWVYEEEQFEKALEYVNEFTQNPEDPRFYQYIENAKMPLGEGENKPDVVKSPSFKLRATSILTSYLLLMCALLFMVSTLTMPIVNTLPPNIPPMPVLSAPIIKKLMYDYPKAYEIIDQITSKFGIEVLQKPDTMPLEAQKLMQEFYNTPYWKGIYDKIVQHIKFPNTPWTFDAPLFEKIRQGEVWRLFTPCLLHQDLFHLIFNMIWLIVLGKQMEIRLGHFKYLLFILPAGIISNTAQYLMSGPNFIGYSGILCAMLTFIWMRQRHAPWEGYTLEKSTIGFITFFVLFMLGLQLLSFFFETFYDTAFFIGIANTAHIAGAIVGIILGRMQFFSWQHGFITPK